MSPRDDSLAALDLARAVAALAVLAGHARAIWFVDFGETAVSSSALRVLSAAFYFFTGLGHQAVMVFFVLSGFFIARSVGARHRRGQWQWRAYAIDRLSRLHIVLLPALLLTLALDRSGASLAPGLYDGSHPSALVGTRTAIDHGIEAFIANNLYLQSIHAPTYGSTGHPGAWPTSCGSTCSTPWRSER